LFIETLVCLFLPKLIKVIARFYFSLFFICVVFSDLFSQQGCTDSLACNYNPLAIVDDGSCIDPTLYFADIDLDGFGNAQDSILLCQWEVGYAVVSGDCNLTDATIFPGAAEICNTADDDCDGWVNEGIPFFLFYMDIDGDGYGQGVADTTCGAIPSGFAAMIGDCDENNTQLNPGVLEIFNNLDDDCDGVIDDVYLDTDGDGTEDLLDDDDDGDGLLDSQENDYNVDGIQDDCDQDGVPNIRDKDECEVFIPEVFTPNGDGVNDVFELGRLPFQAVVKLQVYNRWGALVYGNDAYQNDWRGNNIEGGGLPAGTYPLTLQINDGKVYQKNLVIWR
jgi:gliding motility-associated-like protein